MSDGQFPAKQAERNEYSVAEESRIASRQPRLSEVLKASAARKRGWSIRVRWRREYKVVTWSALLAAASREYLKKHEGEHGDKTAAMTAGKEHGRRSRYRVCTCTKWRARNRIIFDDANGCYLFTCTEIYSFIQVHSFNFHKIGNLSKGRKYSFWLWVLLIVLYFKII